MSGRSLILRPAVAVTAALIAACALAAGSAAAQAPKSSPSADAAAPDARPPSDAAVRETAASTESRDDIRKQFDAAQRGLAAIEPPADTAPDAPPGTPPGEIAERHALLLQLVGVYRQQLDVYDRIGISSTERVEAEKALQSWSGFSAPPPFSVLTIDALRDEEESAESRLASATARRTLFERYGAEIAAKFKTSQAAARLAAELTDAGRSTPGYARLVWQRDLAALRARIDDATREVLDMGVRNAREEAAAADAARDLARRKLAAAGDTIAFTPDDIAFVRNELDSRRRAVALEIERAIRASAAAIEARTAAETQLAQSRATLPTRGETAAMAMDRQAALVRNAEQKREFAITAALKSDLLKEYLLLLDGEQVTWVARSDAARTHSPVEARAMYERLSGTLANLRTWREYVDQQLAAARARVAEQETKLRTTAGEDAAHAAQLLDTFHTRETDLRRAIEQGQPLERLLRRFRTDFEGRRDVSFAERARDAGAVAWLWLHRIWTFEIFTVEDSFETADGRKLNVARSVTLGKTVGALLIVILGYWLCSFVARRVERLIVARAHVPPQSAALLRSWIVFVLTASLIIFALVSSSIPLTAFAFLGGALAIAAGFGLQTLLKNFVAGLMLLFERPMRLDDLVEVDGIRGRVTAVGIRASTLMSADGIETMIPNSAFIENKLTNWTYSSPQTRQTIRVGVAYGTPLRKAADALLDAATRHGLVLKNPAPAVYLDDYAENSVAFALTYWVEMTPDNDTRRIRSDLLHMIDGAFADSGIRMPFPQRDVHLDGSSSLKIEVVASPKAANAAP